MAQIYMPAKKEKVEIDQIVAFGCSLTSGFEILDAERYPMFSDVEAKKKEVGADAWYKEFSRLDCPNERHLQTEEKERKLAWPSQFGKLYDIPVYNMAESASSFEKQITCFLKSYQSGTITSKTLILWGITGIGRGLWLQNDEILSYMLNGLLTPKAVTKDLEPFWINNVNSDYMLLWRHYQCLSNVFNWAKNICNDQFIFINAFYDHLDYNIMPYHEQKRFEHPDATEIIKSYWNILENDYYNRYSLFKVTDYRDDSIQIFYNWAKSKNSLYGAGHPTLEAHIKYAQAIKDELEKRGDQAQ
jgi:hypothetical protein